jgi:hypothetical protein
MNNEKKNGDKTFNIRHIRRTKKKNTKNTHTNKSGDKTFNIRHIRRTEKKIRRTPEFKTFKIRHFNQTGRDDGKY